MAVAGWPGTHVEVIRAKRFLGQCLMKLDRFVAAESLLVDAHQSMLDGFGAANQYTVAVAKDLVELYQRWGRPKP